MLENIDMWILGVVTLANAIVNATPTPKDDRLVGKLYRVLDILALNWTERAKERSK